MMIQAALIIKTVLDKAALHNAAEAITGKNYLRSTDDRNLREHTAEIVSILDCYGYPYSSAHLVNVGFLFAGTTDLISQLPSIVDGKFLTNQESNSQVFGSVIVVADLQAWSEACFRAQGTNHNLEKCFNSVSDQLQSLTPPPINRPRLN